MPSRPVEYSSNVAALLPSVPVNGMSVDSDVPTPNTSHANRTERLSVVAPAAAKHPGIYLMRSLLAPTK